MTCAGVAEDALRLVGDPVDVVTGAVLEDTKDFQLVDGTRIVWRRLYSSARCREDRGLGLGHTHSFDHRLTIDLDGIRYRAPSGASVAFPAFPVAISRVAWRGHVLTRHGHTFVVATPTGLALEFAFRGTPELVLVAVRTNAGVVRLGHDEAGRLRSLANEHGGIVVLTWDADHIVAADAKRRRDPASIRVATYRYDAGKLVEVEDAYRATTRYVHDGDGRIVARADRRGYKVGFRYDADGRCVHSAGEDGVLEVRLAYFPLERRTEVTKADGGFWQYRYDDAGTLTAIVDPEGGTRAFVPRASDGQIATEIDGAGNELRHEYDADGRRVATRDVLGRPLRAPVGHRTAATPIQYELGTFERLPGELPGRAALAPVLSPLALGTLSFAALPGAGRLHEVRDLQGLLVREERDGRARRFAYDAGGNLRWETDLDGARRDYDVASFFQLRGARDANGATTALAYTAENELAAVTDPGGTRTVFLRDKRSDVVAVGRAGAWKERYVRDGAGRLVRKEGAHGLLYSVDRGPQGEVVARRFASGAEETLAHDAWLRLVRGEAPAGTVTFAYDGLGNRVVDELDGEGVRRVFGADQLVALTVLGRFVTRYRRAMDGVGRALVLTDPTGREHVVRALGAGVLRREHPGGRSETVQYHPDGTCLHRVVEGGAAPSWIRSWERTAEGYVVARHDSARGTTRYRHDAAHRIVEEAPPGAPARIFEHDLAGNLVRNGARTAAYAPGNVLVASGGATYGHDAAQAIHEERSATHARRFVRDPRGRLVRVETYRPPTGAGGAWVAEPPIEARYDVLDRRVAKTTAAGTTRFVWDTDRLAAEERPDGTLRVYVYADALALTPLLFVDYASRDAAPESGVVHLVFPDDLGRPERIERLDGTIAWSATYAAYGEATVEVGADFAQPLRWPGHYFDAELGLHQNRFRTYSPALGRYLEPDPLGRGGGLENVYQYT